MASRSEQFAGDEFQEVRDAYLGFDWAARLCVFASASEQAASDLEGVTDSAQRSDVLVEHSVRLLSES